MMTLRKQRPTGDVAFNFQNSCQVPHILEADDADPWCCTCTMPTEMLHIAPLRINLSNPGLVDQHLVEVDPGNVKKQWRGHRKLDGILESTAENRNSISVAARFQDGQKRQKAPEAA